MRKYVWFILLILIMSFTFADIERVDVTYNTKPLAFDVPPRIENNRTLVPIRTLLETYGAAVHWDNATRTVVVSSNQHTISLVIDSTNAIVDGQTVVLDVAPKIEKGRTLVPLRFVSEAFGFDVTWQPKNHLVQIFDLRQSSQLKYGLTPFGVKLTIAEVERAFGAADRVTNSMYGFKWYTYHFDYKNFVMYGVRDGKIVALYTKSPEMFKGIGLKHGDTQTKANATYANPITEIRRREKIYQYSPENILLNKVNGAYVRIFEDAVENHTVSSVMITLACEEESVPSYYGLSDDKLERDFELQLFDLVNADRIEHGLSVVNLDTSMMHVAREHSQDMITNNYFDHVDLAGDSLIDRLNRAGVNVKYAAENIAAGQHNAIMAHEELMNSGSHRNAILGPGHYVSTGIKFGGKYNHYYTEAFFTPVLQ